MVEEITKTLPSAVPIDYYKEFVVPSKRKPQDTKFRHVPTFVYIFTVVIFLLLLFFGNTHEEHNFFRKEHRTITIFLLVLPLMVVLLGFPLYLWCIIAARKFVLQIFLFIKVAFVLLIGGVVFATTGQLLSLIVLVPFLLFIFLSYICFRKFFKLAQVTIETTLEAMKPHFGDLLRNYLLKAVLFMGLLLMCSFSLLKIGDKNKEQRNTLEEIAIMILYFCSFFLVLNLSYTLFLHGAAFCNEQMRITTDPWNCSYEIANHFSQGSVALTSLLIAMVYTARLMVGDGKDKNKTARNDIVMALVLCLLDLLIHFLEFRSAQSLVYVAIYGKGIWKSGKMGFQSLKQKGFTKYISWNIVSQLLSTFAFLIGLMMGLLGGFITYHALSGSFSVFEKVVFTINVGLSLLMGFLFSTEIVNSFVGGYVACQIVLLLEDPELMNERCENATLLRKYVGLC